MIAGVCIPFVPKTTTSFDTQNHHLHHNSQSSSLMAPSVWPQNSAYLPLVPLAFVASLLLLLALVLRVKRSGSREGTSNTSIESPMIPSQEISTDALLSDAGPPPP